MIIAVDIGNSNVVVGIKSGDDWVEVWRLRTWTEGDAAAYYELELRTKLLDSQIDIKAVEGIIMSSVVPILTDMLIRIFSKVFGTQVLLVDTELYKKLNYPVLKPTETGSDLVANAYGIFKKHKHEAIIVDFGTALTFTTINEKGIIQGVAIAPGIKTAMKALSSNTAQLPEIPLELPKSVLGQDTVSAMQAGILWGYVGIVKEILAKTRSEVGPLYMAYATGGLSFVMEPLSDVFADIDRNLTLDGLVYMYRDYQAL